MGVRSDISGSLETTAENNKGAGSEQDVETYPLTVKRTFVIGREMAVP